MDYWYVGWDVDYVQFVDFVQFGCFCLGGVGYVGEFVVELEVVLQCDGGQCLVFGFDFDVFFGFDGLVYVFVVVVVDQYLVGEFVDDEYFIIVDDVVFVVVEQFFGFQSVVEIVD